MQTADKEAETCISMYKYLNSPSTRVYERSTSMNTLTTKVPVFP